MHMFCFYENRIVCQQTFPESSLRVCPRLVLLVLHLFLAHRKVLLRHCECGRRWALGARASWPSCSEHELWRGQIWITGCVAIGLSLAISESRLPLL